MQKIKFRFNDRHIDSFNTPGVLNLMFLDLTNQCQLRCLYCFNHRILDLTPSHLKIDILKKILQARITQNVKNWFLSGGEPLCYRYLDQALEMFQAYGHRPKIATNGIGLRPEVVEKWISSGVQSVQFSIDTLTPSVSVKINGNTAKSHRAVIENLKYSIQSPLRVVVSSVLTRANMDEISGIMRFCHDLGVDSYTLYPDVPAAKIHTDLIVPISQMTNFIDKLISDYAALSSTRIIDMSIPCIQFSDVYEKWKDLVSIRLHACGAGQYNLKITSTGKVSACICQDSPEFIIGDLTHQDIDEIWNSREIERFRSLYTNIPECRICQIKSDCRGGCRNEAFVFGKKGLLSSDPHCDFYYKPRAKMAKTHLSQTD